ncbi:ferric iron reductase FhuF-like transporter family protein, partial [Vibrio parahaemolyticus V-223/04]
FQVCLTTTSNTGWRLSRICKTP